MKTTAIIMAALAAVAVAGTVRAQAPATPAPGAGVARANPPRSPLLWSLAWKPDPGGREVPVSPGALGNPDLELKLYGPGARLDVVGKVGDDGNPPHVFSGIATSQLAFAFRSAKGPADLTGLSRIRVKVKVSGLHRIYPVVKLASGDWYMGSTGAGASTTDWLVEEVPLTGVRWYKLDIANVVTKGDPVDRIDLSRVDEIGFADLIPASGHGPGGWFNLAEIEVFGKPAVK